MYIFQKKYLQPPTVVNKHAPEVATPRHSWRIPAADPNGAGIYGVPWIPSISFMLAYIYIYNYIYIYIPNIKYIYTILYTKHGSFLAISSSRLSLFYLFGLYTSKKKWLFLHIIRIPGSSYAQSSHPPVVERAKTANMLLKVALGRAQRWCWMMLDDVFDDTFTQKWPA